MLDIITECSFMFSYVKMHAAITKCNGNYISLLLLRISLIALIRSASIASVTATVQVTIEQGTLVGTTETSRSDKRFYAFYSVPYAKPPVGPLRFQPPEEPQKWHGVRNVTTYPPPCLQQRLTVLGQEDCLYLNVFSRQLDGKVPVMMFIHGGAFTLENSSLYPPNYIMDYSVVLVTIHYRLGLLGFLSSGDGTLPGNNALKDQVMALKWIKKNIASFGGDPGNVLIFGQSAGAASVHFHMFSPMAKGLFHKGLSLSGSAFAPWSITPPHVWKETFETVALLCGCLFRTASDSVQCLKEVPANELLATQEKLYVGTRGDAVHTLGPTIETDAAPGEAYITKRPRPGDEFDPGIPWMFGTTSAEAIYRVQVYLNDGLTYLNDGYRRLLPVATLSKAWLDDFKTSTAFADDLKRIYFNNSNIGLDTLGPLIQVISDLYFTFGATRAGYYYRGAKYLYYNDYKLRGITLPYDERLTRFGVCHGVDLLYYFNYMNITVTEEHDVRVSENLVKMLTLFAYTGNPNIKDINTKWEPATEYAAPYLRISESGEYKLDTTYFKEKYQIWKKISKYFE